MHFSFRGGSLLVVALILAGCDAADDGVALVPVQGTVTLDDKPLESALVSFIPNGQTLGQGGIAHTDANGQFKLATHDMKRKGVPVGDYKVIISKPLNPDGTPFSATEEVGLMDSNARESLPAIYSDFERTTLSASVQAEGAKLDFKLSSKLK